MIKTSFYIVVLLVLSISGRTLANPESSIATPKGLLPPVESVKNEMHPPFILRDTEGKAIQAHQKEISANKSCGNCHDADFINATSTHAPDKVAVDCIGCHVEGGMSALQTAQVDKEGKVSVLVRSPSSQTCGNCHGVANTEKQTLELGNGLLEAQWPGPYIASLLRGEIFSPQHISDSFLNLKDKEKQDRPWDVHAARLLRCTSCHFTSNNPRKIGVLKKHEKAYLSSDPRVLDTG
ncbi:MAG: cytochrome c3 family protein [Myxococcales bacterium]|nr:MAG: cytochrome c3 family protein [Myxococcales bacterium]